MLRILAETWRSRELLWALTEREINTRYRRSFLGLLGPQDDRARTGDVILVREGGV